MHSTELLSINFEGNKIAYQRVGNGPMIMLAFHGFGQSKQVFESVEEALGKRFTVYAIDLFFHGDSSYSAKTLLTSLDWQRFIQLFLLQNAIDRFSLLGFSLGGRFALATIKAFADRLDQLILIAPDGITRNIWYRLATGSTVGRYMFRYFLQNLTALNRLGRLLTSLGLLNRSAMRFAELSLGTTEQRERVYQSWTGFRLIQPDLLQVSTSLTLSNVRVRFFTGAFDRIVPSVYILPLAKLLEQYESTNLPTGHNHLIALTAELLVD